MEAMDQLHGCEKECRGAYRLDWCRAKVEGAAHQDGNPAYADEKSGREPEGEAVRVEKGNLR